MTLVVLVFLPTLSICSELGGYQTQFHPLLDFPFTQSGNADRITTVNVLIAICGAAVDNLHLLKVDQNATCHGLTALIVILGRGKYGEDPGTLGNGHTFGMSLVSTHNVRKTLLLQKVGHGTMTEADGTTTAERVTEASGRIHPSTFLLIRGWVGPDAIGRHLLMVLILMLERGVDAGHVGDRQDVLNPSSLDGMADAALPTQSSASLIVVVVVFITTAFFFRPLRARFFIVVVLLLVVRLHVVGLGRLGRNLVVCGGHAGCGIWPGRSGEKAAG
mmetsp:Transcript_8636/g.24246  ORF Transcript_8636/g.24246 Transcript_8636/m.24246 type:complete len:275 (-) Transcript_8636:68-892(-)